MATSLTDADRMLELAEANGTRLAIHHQMRTTPTFNVADRLINAGEIGPLTTIKIRGKGYYGGYDMLNIGTHMLNGTRRFAGECAQRGCHVPHRWASNHGRGHRGGFLRLRAAGGRGHFGAL